MLISFRKNFVFIHIFKTGGTSLTRALVPYARFRDRLAYGRSRPGQIAWRFAGRLSGDPPLTLTGLRKHAILPEVLAFLGERRFDRMFSFAVARHPIDWVVSTYFHVARTRVHELHALTREGGLDDFIEPYLAVKPRRQSDFLTCGDGRIRLSFVARHETLEDDWKTICEHIHLPSAVLPRANIGRNRPSESAENLLNNESKALIRDYFAADFKLLGYPA